eukprot:TRINITY_DN352_c0_g3_i1.p1 TRINITY_DN352_c0_g3~~TRINITY_DN352_c0_g3_i1.p1  ORF type:complete len:263 (+),score=54.96 TRINITY_DN352_c0_g3_i1:180-968(+)
MVRKSQLTVIAPILATLVAFTMFFTLLMWWVADGTPTIKETHPDIAFISDVGAIHKGFFIAMGVATAILFVTTMLVDHNFRRMERLEPYGRRKYERHIALAVIFFAIVSAIGLVLLTILDNINHENTHWVFAVIFFLGLLISAILRVSEMGLLSHDYPMINHLRRSYRAKLVIIGWGFAVFVAFIVLTSICSDDEVPYGPRCRRIESAAAVAEWVLAFTFVAYLATLIVDLWPITKDQEHALEMRNRDVERASNINTGMPAQ